jgi:two-component system, OmpR family, phosphate regulon sensor histidine kinase PhoR
VSAERGRRRGRWKSLLGLAAVISFLAAAWTLARWAISAIAPRAGLDPSGWPAGLAANCAALIAFGLASAIISRRARRKLPDSFAALDEALRRIASGDLDVSVDVAGMGDDHPFGRMAGGINQLAESLRKMEELRQEFISTASHELQSPLTSIAGFATALRDERLPPETRLRYVSIIEEEAGRLSRLSDALLRLTSLEAGGLRPRAEPASLDASIRSAALAAEPRWRAKGIDLELDLERVEASVDAAMLAQVWTNLLGNAIKFSGPGGRVRVELRRSGDKALASFSDEGVGISPEDLGFVFDRFFKADRSRSRADPDSGSGLGLAIAKRIVDLHGGAIRAESDGLGAGSRFTVELPITSPASASPS